MGKQAEECRMITLARGPTSHVQRCVHCNCVALHVGPVTLRFDAGAAESLWNTLGQALMRLELEDELAPQLRMKPQGTA
jgi:hypothetical protein